MAGPASAPCALWLDESDLCAPCDELYDLSRFAEAAEAASWVYFMLSGQQYPGACAATVRPCSRARTWRPFVGDQANSEFVASRGLYGLYDLVGPYATPVGWLAGWGSCGCDRDDQCGCGGLSQIELGGAPIVSVDSVWVDGVELTEGTDFRVDDFRWLVRLDGKPWPCCQRLDLDRTHAETFEVTYTWGREPPTMGKMAAAELACEILQACQPAGKCKLPPRTVQAVRQGVTVSIADLVTFLDKGRTGLKWGDLFLKAARSSDLQGADVFSPDLPPPSGRRIGT